MPSQEATIPNNRNPMRFLLDMGCSPKMAGELRARGHDAVHLWDEGLSRMPDLNILQKARDEHRILLTFDLDFGELLAAGGMQLPSVVIFRLQSERTSSILSRLFDVIVQEGPALQEGAIIVVEKFRLRIRHLPIDKPAGEPT